MLAAWTEIFVRDGKVYGLPKDQGALALFVRNDLAEKAGIDPASIKTWDDWKSAAEKMTADGVFGQCTSFDPQRVGALMLQNGATVVQDNKANFADPKAVEATQFWYDMAPTETRNAAARSRRGLVWSGIGQGQDGDGG
jgi:multiple sugar transport system substrate-binding protein